MTQLNTMLKVTHDDFKHNEVILPDQFDKNNKDLVDKINEIIESHNINEDVLIHTIDDLIDVRDRYDAHNHFTDHYLKSEVDTFLTNHKKESSTDHDNRYFTQPVINAMITSLMNTNTQLNELITNHSLSDDHDTRYYIKTTIDTSLSQLTTRIATEEGNRATVDNVLLNAINLHKSSTDHNVLYYTKTYLSSKLLDLQSQINNEQASRINEVAEVRTLTNNHRVSNDHDDRYEQRLNALAIRNDLYSRINNVDTDLNLRINNVDTGLNLRIDNVDTDLNSKNKQRRNRFRAISVRYRRH